jgi:tetratricopeptide (TPR) repeat protein
MRALLPSLVALLLLTGCPAVRLAREGAELAEEGRPYPAAVHYLDALDQNPRLGRAERGLAEVKQAAYEARLAAAREAEAAERYPDALAAYRDLAELLRRLEAHGGLGAPAIDVAERIDAMENAAADAQYRHAELLFGNRAYEKAIAAYRAALSFKPGYRDAERRIGEAWLAWGEADEATGAWRSAAGRFAEAARAGNASGAPRAGSLYAALGSAHLAAGTCRQAVRDLRSARDHLGATPVAQPLAAAEACARTPVAVLPFANPTRAAPGGVGVPDALAEALGASVDAAASSFVDVLTGASLERVLADARTTAARAVAAGRLPGAHWMVVGELSAAAVDAPRETVTERTVSGWILQPCAEDASRACRKDVTVRYLEHDTRVSVRIAGQLRVVDARSGALSATWPFDMTRADQARFADAFRGPDGREVRVVRGDPDVTRGEVAVPPELVELRDARRALTPPADLARGVIADLAGEARSVVVGVVDAEPPLRDPVELSR